jgi:cytochrome c oxidase subunit 4
MAEHSPQSHGPVVEHGTSHGHTAGHGHAAHGPPKGIAKYIVVFVLLCLLTSASFFTYSPWWRAHFSPQVSWAFMMAVSCTKAMLVILFFMHVMYEANWKFILTIPAALMSIFLILMLVPDVGMRGRWASEERKFHQAEERRVEVQAGPQPSIDEPLGQQTAPQNNPAPQQP